MESHLEKDSEVMVKENLYPAPSSRCDSKGRVVQMLHALELFPLPGREGLRIFWILQLLPKGERDAQPPTAIDRATSGQGLPR